MKITINQFRKNYKNDLIRLMKYDLKSDKPFTIFILIYFVIFIVNFLNKNRIISLKPEIFEMLTVSLGVGLLAMLAYTGIFVLKTLKKIKKEANILYEGKVNITMNADCIMIQKENDEYSYKTDWNQIKELTVINETAYLIPVKKNDFMIRINKKEIVEGNFQEIVNFVASKWEVVDNG